MQGNHSHLLTNRHRRWHAPVAAVLVVAAAMGWPATTRSAPAQVSITPDRVLNYGSFMVFGSGSRTISAGGAVTDIAVVPIDGTQPEPARFTVTYDRGNPSPTVLNIELQVVVATLPTYQQGGLTGTVSALQTDLPGALNISPGQPIRITIPACRTRVCSRSFNVGGRLNVTRQFGGGTITIPIPMDVTVISARRA